MQLHLKLSLYVKNVRLHVHLYIMNMIFKEFDFYRRKEAISWAV